MKDPRQYLWIILDFPTAPLPTITTWNSNLLQGSISGSYWISRLPYYQLSPPETVIYYRAVSLDHTGFPDCPITNYHHLKQLSITGQYRWIILDFPTAPLPTITTWNSNLLQGSISGSYWISRLPHYQLSPPETVIYYRAVSLDHTGFPDCPITNYHHLKQ